MGTSWIQTRATSQESSLQTGRMSRNSYSRSNSYLLRTREAWMAGLPAHVGIDAPGEIPTIIAVGGGKGGVGKSILSANIAAKLGRAGFKVLLVDLDLGSANLHTYFGMSMPNATLAQFVLYQQSPFSDLIVETDAPGVSMVAAGKDESWSDSGEFGSGALLSLWDSLLLTRKEHKFDFVILDLGAGTHRHTIDFYCSAHVGIVTVLPEPTSIENAYSFLKAAMWRFIENAGIHTNACAAADEIKEVLFNPQRGGGRGSLLRKLVKIHKIHPELVAHILQALDGRLMGFVINQIRSQRDIDIGPSMATVSKNYFGYRTSFLGYLNYDDAAWKSLRNRRLLVLDFPHSILTRRIGEVTAGILSNVRY